MSSPKALVLLAVDTSYSLHVIERKWVMAFVFVGTEVELGNGQAEIITDRQFKSDMLR